MKDVITKEFEGVNVSFEVINGESYVMIDDVARFCGWTQIKNGKEYIKWERVNEKLVLLNSPTLGKGDYIPERVMYPLIGMADFTKNPKAREFMIWVGEVISEIRQGKLVVKNKDSYMIDDPVKRAERWIEEEKERQRLIEENKQKDEEILSLAYELDETSKLIKQIEDSSNTLLVREVAKIASKFDINIGEKKLWEKLREWGLVIKGRTEPKQEYVNRKYFILKGGVHTEGEKNVNHYTMRVTGKGQAYIIKRLIDEHQEQKRFEI